MGRAWLVLAVALLGGCEERPSAATFAGWRKEAQEANAKRVAETHVDAGGQWTVRIEGQVERVVDVTLSEIQHAEAAEVAGADYSSSRFRGPRLTALIDRAGARAEAKTVTLVGKDGYFATFELADVRALPILLAHEQDGMPTTPGQGGPVSVRFDPRSFTPELQRRYQNNGVLYVTHMIVGDEKAHLRIGGTTLGDEDLDKLGETSLTDVTVGYRSGWEPTPQTLYGVTLRTALKAAGVTPADRQEIHIYGKDALHQERERAPVVRGSDLDRCTVTIVRSFGPDRVRVPSKRGGPLLLAMNRTCRESFGRGAWLWFVESVEVDP